jgi:hypothetical protein
VGRRIEVLEKNQHIEVRVPGLDDQLSVDIVSRTVEDA